MSSRPSPTLLALEISWTPSSPLLKPAGRLAVELGHPVYDCVYLVLAASRVGVAIWTGR